MVSLLVWLAFGAVAIPMLLDRMSPVILLYAVLSLTVVRMVPVAIAAIGSGLDRNTILFIGWFGPRGLASLVFALLALEELGQSEAAVAVPSSPRRWSSASSRTAQPQHRWLPGTEGRRGPRTRARRRRRRHGGSRAPSSDFRVSASGFPGSSRPR